MYNGPQRKNQRLRNYNYSQNGYYFITICTKDRENYFGEIIEGKMILNEYGKIVEIEILKTEELRKEVKIDLFVIMPNHIHLLIVIENINVGCDCIAPNKGTISNNGTISNVGCDCIAPNKGTISNNGTMQSFPTVDKTHFFNEMGSRGLKGNHLSSIIRSIKGTITKQINSVQNDFKFGWQKSFFDVIIRNDQQLQKTRQYIIDNPLKWELDKNNKENEELVKKIKKEKGL